MKDPNTGAYRPGTEMLDGHQIVAYNSQFCDDAGAFTGVHHIGQSTRTLPTLNEMRFHITDTNRDDLTWDDINNLRARDGNGHVIETNGGNVGGGYVYTGEALLLDINPHFDYERLHPDDGDGTTMWDSDIVTDVALAIAELNTSLAGSGYTLSLPVNGELTLSDGTTTYTGASALGFWVNFANFSITATNPVPLCQGSCPLLHFSSISQVGGIGR